MLTPLQRQIVDLIRELSEAEELALAGGAALIVRDLVRRETHDLDYFAPDKRRSIGWRRRSSGAWWRQGWASSASKTHPASSASKRPPRRDA